MLPRGSRGRTGASRRPPYLSGCRARADGPGSVTRPTEWRAWARKRRYYQRPRHRGALLGAKASPPDVPSCRAPWRVRRGAWPPLSLRYRPRSRLPPTVRLSRVPLAGLRRRARIPWLSSRAISPLVQGSGSNLHAPSTPNTADARRPNHRSGRRCSPCSKLAADAWLASGSRAAPSSLHMHG